MRIHRALMPSVVVAIALLPSMTFAQQQRVFVSSQTVANAGLNDPEAWNDFCQTAADDAGLGGHWNAWISNSTVDASDRLLVGSGPFVDVQGATIANDLADLTDGSLAQPIVRDETGASWGDVTVWTGTLPDGTRASETCGDWTIGSFAGVAFVGSPVSTASDWTAAGAAPCGLTGGHVYCFEVTPPVGSTYSYIGNDFTSHSGACGGQDNVVGSFTLAHRLAANLQGADFRSLVTDYAWSACGETCTSDAPCPGTELLALAWTDASGNLVSWTTGITYPQSTNQLASFNEPGASVSDDHVRAGVVIGQNAGVPGQYRVLARAADRTDVPVGSGVSAQLSGGSAVANGVDVSLDVSTGGTFSLDHAVYTQEEIPLVVPESLLVWAPYEGSLIQMWDLAFDGEVAPGTQATVTIAYDESALVSGDALLQVIHCPSDGSACMVVPAVVDPVSDTVTVSVDSFSPFLVVQSQSSSVPGLGGAGLVALVVTLGAAASRVARKKLPLGLE